MMLIHEAEINKIQSQYEDAVNKNNELIQQLERVIEHQLNQLDAVMSKSFFWGNLRYSFYVYAGEN